MVELADTLVDDFDIVDVLTTLSDRCVEVLDVAAAGIMLAASAGGLQVVTSSSQMMRAVELFELQSNEGPCLDAYRSGHPVASTDLETARGRWPRFAGAALAARFRSVDAIPMRLRGTVIGALNLFRTETGALSTDDVAVAQAMADVATIAILQHRTAIETSNIQDQLTGALDSRVIIEQAKGTIAERQQVEMPEAFAQLRRYARNHNRRLTDIATEVVDGTITLPAADSWRRDW